MPTVLSIRKKW